MGQFLKKLLPGRLKRWLRDLPETFRRLFPKKHAGVPKHGLNPTQVYPEGINFDEVLLEATRVKAGGFKIKKDTPVSSIGSCFAEEFAHHMISKGYNYLRAPGDRFNASCDWGRVYSIPNLKQIVDYSFDPRFPMLTEKTEAGWFDPLRDHSTPFYKSEEEARAAITSHREDSRKVFTSTEVLAITLGQNEIFRDRSSGLAWARKPPQNIIDRDPGRYHPEELSYESNVEGLKQVVSTLLAKNPKLTLIMTVSPVPAFATFVDPDVVAQSFANKCLLRTVVRTVQAAFPGKIHYFPSFEITLAYNPYTYKSDNRHVKRQAVARIFRIFEDALV